MSDDIVQYEEGGELGVDPKAQMYDLGDGQQIEVYDFDFEDAEKELAGLRSDIRQIPEGDNFYRFLPPTGGAKTPFVQVWQHYISNPAKPDDPPYVYTCPRKLFGDQTHECESCDRIEAYSTDPDPALREIAQDLSARLRVFAPVIDRSDDSVCILSMPPTVYKAVLAVGKNRKASGGRSFVHLENGYDIVINREGSTKLNTKYKAYPSMEETGPVDVARLTKVPKTASIMGKIPNMSEVSEKIDTLVQYAPRPLPASPPRPAARPVPQRPVVNAAPAPRQLPATPAPVAARPASAPPAPVPAKTVQRAAPRTVPAAPPATAKRPASPAIPAKPAPTHKLPAPAPITEIADETGETFTDLTEPVESYE